MATFVKSAQGRVALKKQDGSTITVRLAALSDSDQEWVAEHSRDAASETPAPPSALPDAPTFSADEALLLRMASQGYIKGRKRVAELDEPQSLVRLANQRGDTLPLARLILCRELKSKSLVEVRAEMGEHFAGAVEALQGAVLDSANRQGAGGMQVGDDGQTLFNAPTDLLGEIEGISAGIGDTVNSAVDADRQRRDLMREAWELEGAVGRRVERQFQLDQLPPLAEDAVALTPSHYKSGDAPFAAINLRNTRSGAIAWAIVIVRLDCEYTEPAESQRSTAAGQALVGLLSGGAAPDYRARDRAFEAYSNVDKHSIFYIEEWNPRETLRLVSVSAPEYVNTVKDVAVDVYTSVGKQHIGVDVEKHSKRLRAKFEPKRSRR